jgi:hypothetical protein
MGNLYAYALRQPFKYLDPDGLEPQVTLTKAAAADPTFKLAWKVYSGTRAGQAQLAKIKELGGTVVIDVFYAKKGAISATSWSPVGKPNERTISFAVRRDASARDIEDLATKFHSQVEGFVNPLLSRQFELNKDLHDARMASYKTFRLAGALTGENVPDPAALEAQRMLVLRRDAMIYDRVASQSAFAEELTAPVQGGDGGRK